MIIVCRKVFSFHIFACLHILYIIIGGVGILATGPLSADETRNAIRTIRSNTDKPFGIGAITLYMLANVLLLSHFYIFVSTHTQ